VCGLRGVRRCLLPRAASRRGERAVPAPTRDTSSRSTRASHDGGSGRLGSRARSSCELSASLLRPAAALARGATLLFGPSFGLWTLPALIQYTLHKSHESTQCTNRKYRALYTASPSYDASNLGQHTVQAAVAPAHSSKPAQARSNARDQNGKMRKKRETTREVSRCSPHGHGRDGSACDAASTRPNPAIHTVTRPAAPSPRATTAIIRNQRAVNGSAIRGIQTPILTISIMISITISPRPTPLMLSHTRGAELHHI
jgi:hypothetical protein